MVRAGCRFTDEPDAVDSYPAWSPDGTKIAFQRDYNNDESFEQVWVMDADGSNQMQLTDYGDGADAPSWSPDGSTIIFNAFPEPNGGAGPALFVVNSDGSGLEQLTTDNDWDRWPSYSPDGSKIAFVRNNPDTSGNEIWLIDADGSNPVQLTDGAVSSDQSQFPSWSPDGSQILYQYRTGAPAQYFLKVMNADGSDQHEIAGPRVAPARWSPDGELIVLPYSTGDDDFGIWTATPDGDDLTPILIGEVADPSWQRIDAPVNPTTTTTAAPTTSAGSRSETVTATPRFTG